MVKKLGVEMVKWLDSQGVTSGWHGLEDYKPEMPVMESIGFVVYEDKQMICLCGNIGKETATTLFQGNGIMAIPKRCIVSRKKVKV